MSIIVEKRCDVGSDWLCVTAPVQVGRVIGVGRCRRNKGEWRDWLLLRVIPPPEARTEAKPSSTGCFTLGLFRRTTFIRPATPAPANKIREQKPLGSLGRRSKLQQSDAMLIDRWKMVERSINWNYYHNSLRGFLRIAYGDNDVKPLHT